MSQRLALDSSTPRQINDRHEFYEELDLDAEGRRYLAAEAPPTRNKYRLLAVLVHSGGVHGGHYYAFVRWVGGRVYGG